MWTHVQCMACVLMYQHLLFGQRICCGLFLWTQVLGTWTESERRKQKLDWLATFQPKEKCNPCHFVWVKSKLQHPPPPSGQPPTHLTFLRIIVQIPPYPSQNAVQMPPGTLGSIQVIKCPHPRDISQAQKWQKDGRNAFSCRTKSL